MKSAQSSTQFRDGFVRSSTKTSSLAKKARLEISSSTGEATYDSKSRTFHSDEFKSHLWRDDVKEIRKLRVKRRDSLWNDFLRQLRYELDRRQLQDFLIKKSIPRWEGEYFASLWHQTKGMKSTFSIEVRFNRQPKKDRWTVSITTSSGSPYSDDLFIENKLSAKSAVDLLVKHSDSLWGSPLDC